MRRTLVLTALALLLAGCNGGQATVPLLPAPSPTTGASGGAARVVSSLPGAWGSTATQALSLNGATALGTLDPATPLSITVALKLRDLAGAQALVRAQSTAPGSFLTPGQFTANFGPTSDQAQQVATYLRAQGLTVGGIEPNNMLVTATGTAAQIASAFHTSLSRFSLNGANVFANTAPAMVPSALSGTVLAVLGLNNVQNMKPPKHRATLPPCFGATVPVTASCIRSYDSRAFQIVYDALHVVSGRGTPVAVFAEGNVAGVLPDLRTYEANNALPNVPYSTVQVGLASPDTAGADEWDLDTQTSTGIAANVAHLYVYVTTSLSDSDITLMFNRFATQNVARAGNASFGGCEFFSFLDGSMLVDDQIFLQAAAQGQTVFAATGDVGSSCPVAGPTNGVPGAGPPFVSYPAASPYVIAAGGTTLSSNADGTYAGEIAWNAGGGGLSQFEGSPFWQSGVIPAAATAANLRALPDIAMDADPNTGAIIYVNGQPAFIGGTSLSSPLAMGVWARLQTAHSNRLGFAAPRLYAEYVAHPSGTTPAGTPPTSFIGGFHDVLVGTNGLYTALPRYDLTTGLGTFDVARSSGAL